MDSSYRNMMNYKSVSNRKQNVEIKAKNIFCYIFQKKMRGIKLFRKQSLLQELKSISRYHLLPFVTICYHFLIFLLKYFDKFLTFIIYFWIRVAGTSSRIQIKTKYQ